MRFSKTTFSLLAVLGALVLAGCGDDDATTTTSSSDEAAAETSTTTSEESSSVDTSEKPVVEAGEGDPPTELTTTDIVVGDGPEAKAGDQVTVQYVGVDYVTGQQFDASWDRGQTFPFPLGGGQVIPGWDQGVAGMKEGGRRELVIPPDLAYGAQGFPPDIAPNATLIFVVDLVKVK